jgi:hypothetical protein
LSTENSEDWGIFAFLPWRFVPHPFAFFANGWETNKTQGYANSEIALVSGVGAAPARRLGVEWLRCWNTLSRDGNASLAIEAIPQNSTAPSGMDFT